MAVILRFVITLIMSAAVIWLAQKIVLTKEKEKGFLSVLALALVWALIENLLYYFFWLTSLGFLERLVTLVIWIWVLKSWFKVGWFQASIISLIAWVLNLTVAFFLGFLVPPLGGSGAAALKY